MNSNNDIENTRKVSARKWDELLDRYFSSVILPKVDTERVMTLTRLKIPMSACRARGVCGA